MSESSLSPVNLNVVRSQNKDYLYEAITEQRNPFCRFDWGDHVICTPQNTQPGLIASSKPYWSSLACEYSFWYTHSPTREKAWKTVITPEISKLAEEFALPLKSMSTYRLARGESGNGVGVIDIRLDAGSPVKKADAEAFVQRCSEMLVTHQFNKTVIEVHH